MRYSIMIEGINKIVKSKGLKLGTVDISSKMQAAIERWDQEYQNKAYWLSRKQGIFSAGLPAAISAEMARLVTIELKSVISGSARAEFLNDIYSKNVLPVLRSQIEYAVAKGGMIMKPYPADETIAIQFCQADAFFPISFDSNGKLLQCAFAEQYTKGKELYTRVELHSCVNGTVKINNLCFHSSNGSTLGTETALTSVDQWKDIEPECTLEGICKLTIGYFKMPIANTVDSSSPLGVSIFSRAEDLIRVADKRYSQIDWEYDSKETAIHVSEQCLKYDKTNDKFTMPGGKDRLYRTLNYSTGVTDKPLIDTFSPDIRDQSFLNGYNAQLRRIEFDCGLAYGTLSDVQTTDKTAEEIKSSKQRSYATVSDIQKALQNALIDLIDAMDFWADAEKLCQAGNYEVSFDWDDSIIVDSDKDLDRDLKLQAAGIKNAWENRAKWCGEDEETAKNNLPETAQLEGEL